MASSVDHLVSLSSHEQLRLLLQHMRGRFLQLLLATGTGRTIAKIFDFLPADAGLPPGDGDGAPPLLDTLRALVAEIEADVPQLLNTLSGAMSLRGVIAAAAGRPQAKSTVQPPADAPVLLDELAALAAGVLDAGHTVSALSTFNPSSLVVQELLAALAKVLRQLPAADDVDGEEAADPQMGQRAARLRGLYDRLRDGVVAAFDTLVADKTGAHVLDALVEHALDADYEAFVREAVAPRAAALLAETNGNFLLRNCLEHARTGAHLELLGAALPAESLQAALQQGNRGTVVALVTAAARLGQGQKACVRKCTDALKGTFLLAKDAHTPVLTARLLQAEWTTRNGLGNMAHVLLQQLFQVGCPAAQVYFDGLLELAERDAAALARHACSKSGSRAVEAFFRGAPPQHALRVARALLPHALALAKDECGSYVLQAAYHGGSLDLRTAVAGALAPHAAELQAFPSGLMLVKHCRLEQFRLHREEWDLAQTADARRSQLMAQIVGALDAKMQEAPKGQGGKKGPAPPKQQQQQQQQQKREASPPVALEYPADPAPPAAAAAAAAEAEAPKKRRKAAAAAGGEPEDAAPKAKQPKQPKQRRAADADEAAAEAAPAKRAKKAQPAAAAPAEAEAEAPHKPAGKRKKPRSVPAGEE